MRPENHFSRDTEIPEKGDLTTPNSIPRNGIRAK